MPQPDSIPAMIAAHAREAPDAPALLAPGRSTLTYGGLGHRMSLAAEQLAGAGLGRGHRIALCIGAGPEHAVALLSIMSCATCVPVNADMDSPALRTLLERARVDAVIVSRQTAPHVAPVGDALHIRVLLLTPLPDEAAGAFALECGNHRGAQPRPPIGDDVALVMHTSGSTGLPKIVPLTQRSQVTEAMHRIVHWKFTARDRSICLAPPYTASALRRSLFPMFAAGGSVVCPPSFDGERLYDWLTEFEPTFYASGPAVHQSLLDAVQRRGGPPAHKLRYAISGTTALGQDTQMRLEAALGVPVIQTYAMTETGGIAQNPIPPGTRRPKSVGLPGLCEVRILDGKGPAGTGEWGEIVVRGPSVFAGYEGDPQLNAQSFTDGWFRTGDLGYFDGDGYLFITGRAKELINRGGFKVSPAEVDAAFASHPAVKDVATYGVPHASLGEDVATVVVLREGAAATAQELRDFAFATIADYKVPTTVLLVDAIPRTGPGKLRRAELPQRFATRSRAAYDAPRNEHERAVVRAFEEVLHLDAVGRDDNFFALGGDSLRSLQVAARINDKFACHVRGSTLFRRPTPAEFAPEIERSTRQHGEFVPPPIARLRRGGKG
jgi:acyl-CoA synthetase (AMP-forming)/AMP-acid ligase II